MTVRPYKGSRLQALLLLGILLGLLYIQYINSRKENSIKTRLTLTVQNVKGVRRPVGPKAAGIAAAAAMQVVARGRCRGPDAGIARRWLGAVERGGHVVVMLALVGRDHRAQVLLHVLPHRAPGRGALVVAPANIIREDAHACKLTRNVRDQHLNGRVWLYVRTLGSRCP